MLDSKIYTYAYYKINDRPFYQYLPTGNINDTIYVKGMRWVEEKKFIKDGNYYIEIPIKSKTFGVGTPVYSSDIVERYYAGDSLLQKCDKDDIEYLANSTNRPWTLYGDGEVSLGHYKSYIGINNGTVPEFEIPENTVNGEAHWYLELKFEDGTVKYEKTICDDKKYRGQKCEKYSFVRVLEYNLNGEKKQRIIERSNYYPYHYVEATWLDDILNQAKRLIVGKSNFSGFAGVSPLYSFNTEDSACVFHDNQSKIRDNNILTVTGSGDAILDLFLYGAKKVIAFDTNILTIFFAELKFTAAKYLSFDEFGKFFNDLDEKIYRKIENYLSNNCRLFWNELYNFCQVVDMPLKNYENGGLFQTSMTFFASNDTIGNDKGYYNEKQYLKLQQILKSKSLEDVSLIHCDLFDLPNKFNLKGISYAYLSNIMDFLVGVDKCDLKVSSLEEFKNYILNALLPSLKENADVDLSYLKSSWHMPGDFEKYSSVYPEYDGFVIKPLSNNRDYILSFESDILRKKSNYRR